MFIQTGETPLHIACGQGSVDVVNVLLRHPDAEIALPRYVCSIHSLF